MRKQSFDEKLIRLRDIAAGPISAEAVNELRGALNGSQGVLAALAAQIAGQRRIADLAPDLIKAFSRFMVETDKTCQVKTAVVDALHRLDCREADEVYLRGIKHVQMEPAFGRPPGRGRSLLNTSSGSTISRSASACDPVSMSRSPRCSRKAAIASSLIPVSHR